MIAVPSLKPLIVPLVLYIGAAGFQSAGPKLERVLSLRPDQVVFAYSRISPNGEMLAFASEPRDASAVPVLEVVSLRERRQVFTEAGVDAYWSPDGAHLIFLALGQSPPSVSIRNTSTGEVFRNVVRRDVGDYFSWGTKDGIDTILTVQGKYFALNSGVHSEAVASVPECPSLGKTERPLISKDGRRVSAFSNGALIVRNVEDCRDILRTNVYGAKADFSWDGRFLAFHAAKPIGTGYEIRVIDLKDMTTRTITNLTGNSLFPSWTRDGRLCFRYEGPEFRGFMMAQQVLSAVAHPLTPTTSNRRVELLWSDFVQNAPNPRRVEVLLVWAPWNSHSFVALPSIQDAAKYYQARNADLGFSIAAEGSAQPGDVRRVTLHYPRLPQLILAADIEVPEITNQIPATFIFVDGILRDRRLGAQTSEDLIAWIAGLNLDSPTAQRRSAR